MTTTPMEPDPNLDDEPDRTEREDRQPGEEHAVEHPSPVAGDVETPYRVPVPPVDGRHRVRDGRPAREVHQLVHLPGGSVCAEGVSVDVPFGCDAFDYDRAPERYRLGMAVAHAHAAVSLYEVVAARLGEYGARRVLDVGCADGVLRAALRPAGPLLIGLDASGVMLRAHPAPVVRADATRLPFADGVFDAVTALNVLYHLADPLDGVREARRVLRPGGRLIASAIARDDSPEFDRFWTRPATSFDAEDAADLLGRVFGEVLVERWDAPLVVLPDRAAVSDYLLGRQVPAEVARQASQELDVPLSVTKRGAILVARAEPDMPG